MASAFACHKVSAHHQFANGTYFTASALVLKFLAFFILESNFSHKKIPPFKPILTLEKWGQKCFVKESEPFEITDFDLCYIVNFKPDKPEPEQVNIWQT